MQIKQIILGIDPGLRETGWGVIDFSVSNGILKYIASGSINTQANDPLANRLTTLFHGVNDKIRLYQPCLIAIEEIFVNRNPVSTMKLCHARAAAILAAGESNIKVIELHNRQIKQSIVGIGNAKKKQMLTMIQYLIPNLDTKNEHAIDALAVSICAYHYLQNLRK